MRIILTKAVSIIVLLFMVVGCASIEVTDDGAAEVGLDDCEGVAFSIIVEQSPPPGNPYPRQEVHNPVVAKDGILKFKLRNPDIFDFAGRFEVTLVVSGQDSEECPLHGYKWTFEGVLQKNGSTYSVDLEEFTKEPL